MNLKPNNRVARTAQRKAAIGCLSAKYAGYPPVAFDILPSMTDAEYEQRIARKFGGCASSSLMPLRTG